MTRPRFHLTPPQGWMNDPVGITWRDDRFHVFYQEVAGSTSWAESCAWGHATTTDFVGWEHLPSALLPGDGDDGCWSGCAVPGTDTLLYSAVTSGRLGVSRIRAASADDPDWERWTKGDVVATAPSELDLVVFRDPVVQQVGDAWLMLVGGGLADGTACVVGYSAPAPEGPWTCTGLVASRHADPDEPLWTGRAWECPQLVAVGDRHVLVVSTWADDVTLEVLAAVGTLTDGRLEIERWQRLGHGPAPYAATTFRDAAGEPALMAWLRGVEDPADGWAGAQGVPLAVDLVDGEVRLDVHPAVALPTVAAPAGEAAYGWDLRWSPEPGDVVRLLADDDVVVELRNDGDEVEVRVGDRVDRAPSTTGTVRVLVDGPVLEVLTGAALFGSAIAAERPVRVEHTGDGGLDARLVLA